MTTTYKNIVYDGATLIAGGNIHIGDVVYQAGEDFHHSMLFLRIEGSGQSFNAQLSVKSRHGGAGNLGKSGEPLLQQAIHLDLPERLFQQVEALQETRRSTGDLLRNVRANSAHAVQAQEAQVSQVIFTTFFSGDIGTVCHDFIQLLQKRKVSELLLAISADDERVKNLPWEMVIPHLFTATEGVEKRSLAVRNFGLVRTMEASLAAFDLQGKPGNAAPLKMLFITALPENLSERDKLLEIEDEQRKLIEAVGKLEATGSQPKIVTEFLDNASLEEINAALSARRHDIVHLSGHGAYLAHVRQGVLFLENEWGDEQQASGAELGETLRQHPCVKLLILSACETAICGTGSVIEQLATGSGIPAILAMRFAITDPAAKRFTTALYEMLAKGETLAHATSHAREALWQEVEQRRQSEPERPCPAEWFTPTVWLNQYTGPMVDLRQPYLLPDDFYPHSRFLKTHKTKLKGAGFIGRKRYLIRLRRLFSEGKTTCLHGLGGMGKTTLAEAFAHGYDNGSHEVIPFRNAHEINEKHILDELFARFCDQQQQPEPSLRRQLQSRLENPELDPTQKLQALLDNYLAGRKTILLFDNFEDMQKGEDGAMQQAIGSEGLRAFLLHLCRNAPKGCHLLFTTRYKIADLDGLAAFVALDKMGYAEQYRLMNFSQHLRRIPMAQRDSVYRRLDGHPRAYEFLETLLAEDPSFDWAGLDASVGAVEAKVFEDLLLEKIWERLTETEQSVLKMASIFIAHAPLAALAAVSGLPETELLPVLQSLNRWSVCFLEEDGGFEVHRLTREWVVREFVSEEERKGWALGAGEFYRKGKYLSDGELSRQYFKFGENWEKYLEVSFSLEINYRSIGSYQNAIDICCELLDEDINKSANISALNCLGAVNIHLGNYDNALYLLNSSLYLNNDESFISSKGVTFYHLGLLYFSKGAYEDAMSNLQYSLDISKKTSDKRGGASVLKKIADIQFIWGEVDIAENLLKESMEIANNFKDVDLMGFCYELLGQIKFQRGSDDEALNFYMSALEIARKAKNKQGESAALSGMNQVYSRLGDKTKALICLNESLEIANEIGDLEGIGRALSNIGMINNGLGNIQIGRDYLIRGLAIQKSIGDRKGESASLLGLSSILNAEGNTDEALKCIEQAIEIQSEIGDMNGAAYGYSNIGILVFSIGNIEDAILPLMRALSIFDSIESNQKIVPQYYLNEIIEKIGERKFHKIMRNHIRSKMF